ncbi:metallophosphoesterase [Streptomyces sp. NBC_00249]|uniref:metallophosphoesterase family protein n=1 Tax=Streptomyces sp. NBC_00249 TaxID=2975690 RepID=UPI00225829D6|nr:metallophosphoesterase [Streptomyces sp. NBC_00249]MCX5199591.1 metallophosphoesterase [Streptomyces sp. NBC_00249]
MPTGPGRLLAISDLHVRHDENKKVVDGLRPETPDDWLLLAGDVSESAEDFEWTLALLRDRFAKVVWAPGNHELWTTPDDPLQLRGEARYRHFVDICRRLGVTTPEDPYPVWEGEGGPVAVAPLFLLYDYTFRPAGARSHQEAMDIADRAGVVCTDEFYLHPDPYPSRQAWSRARVEHTAARLAEIPHDLKTVLVNHYPLVREPTRILRFPEFALWCGTEATEDWPVRFRAAAVVYGHLHIPRLIHQDGVPHHEVSLGYPREWKQRPAAPAGAVRILAERP